MAAPQGRTLYLGSASVRLPQFFQWTWEWSYWLVYIFEFIPSLLPITNF